MVGDCCRVFVWQYLPVDALGCAAGQLASETQAAASAAGRPARAWHSAFVMACPVTEGLSPRGRVVHALIWPHLPDTIDTASPCDCANAVQTLPCEGPGFCCWMGATCMQRQCTGIAHGDTAAV